MFINFLNMFLTLPAINKLDLYVQTYHNAIVRNYIPFPILFRRKLEYVPGDIYVQHCFHH